MTSGTAWYLPAPAWAEWTFIVAPSFVAAVDSAAEPEAIDALWDVVGAPAPAIEDIVAAIPVSSAGGVDSFAVVCWGEPHEADPTQRTVSAVVRGRAALDVFSIGGARRFSSGGITPWMLADFRSVTGVGFGSDDGPRSSVARRQHGSHPLKEGVVTSDSLLWAFGPVEVEAVEVEAAGVEAADAGPEHARPAPVGPVEVGAASEVTAADHDGRDTAVHAVDNEETIVSVRAAKLQNAEVDDTILVSRRGTRQGPAEPHVPPAQESPADRFGFTIAGGAVRTLTAPTVIGRNPTAPRVVSGRTPTLVTVDSPDVQVSASHLRLTQEGGAVVVTDLRSTNGTIVRHNGGKRHRMRPGESLVVLAGSSIDIGDGNIIEIMRLEHHAEAVHPGDSTAKGPV